MSKYAAILVLLWIGVACETKPAFQITVVDGSILSVIDAEREAPSEEITEHAPVVVSALPQDLLPYKMASPTAVFVGDAPHCRVFVADLTDQALHAFDFSGNFSYSVPLTRSFANPLRAVTRMYVRGGTELVVKDLVTARTVTVDLVHRNLTVSEPDSARFDPDEGGASLLPKDLLPANHAMELVVAGDPELTNALNRGERHESGDTVWFARFVDGRIFRSQRIGTAWSPPEIVELPLYFRIAPPKHAKVEGPQRIPIQHQKHLYAFTRSPAGHFVYAQTIEPYMRWTIVLEDSFSNHRIRLSADRVRDVAAGLTKIATVESVTGSETWSRRRRVKIYDNPLASEIGGCEDRADA